MKWQKAKLIKEDGTHPDLLGCELWVKATKPEVNHGAWDIDKNCPTSETLVYETNLVGPLSGGLILVPTMYLELMPEFSDQVVLETLNSFKQRVSHAHA